MSSIWRCASVYPASGPSREAKVFEQFGHHLACVFRFPTTLQKRSKVSRHKPKDSDRFNVDSTIDWNKLWLQSDSEARDGRRREKSLRCMEPIHLSSLKTSAATILLCVSRSKSMRNSELTFGKRRQRVWMGTHSIAVLISMVFCKVTNLETRCWKKKKKRRFVCKW